MIITVPALCLSVGWLDDRPSSYPKFKLRDDPALSDTRAASNGSGADPISRAEHVRGSYTSS